MAAAVTHTISSIAPGHRPTAAEVRAFEASVYAAARSYPSHRGGGILGHVCSVMPAAQYQAIPNTVAWIDPVPPAQPLVIPNNTSAALTAAMVRQHTADLEEFSTFVATMNTLRSLVLDNMDNVFLGHLRDRLLNFAGVHPRDMLQHLIATYCWITTYPVGCRDLYVVIKINALERVSSLLEHVIYSTSASPKISLVNEVLVGLEWRDLIGQHLCHSHS